MRKVFKDELEELRTKDSSAEEIRRKELEELDTLIADNNTLNEKNAIAR